MAYPKDLRNQLGISQEAFAILIKCNASQLSMAESGQRELPSGSSPFLAALESGLEQASGNNPSPLPLTDQGLTWLNKHSRECAATKYSLQRQLENVNSKIAEMQGLVQVANLVNSNPLFSAGSPEGMQLDLLKQKAERKLRDVQLQVLQLQLSIGGLEAEIAMAKALIPSP